MRIYSRKCLHPPNISTVKQLNTRLKLTESSKKNQSALDDFLQFYCLFLKICLVIKESYNWVLSHSEARKHCIKVCGPVLMGRGIQSSPDECTDVGDTNMRHLCKHCLYAMCMQCRGSLLSVRRNKS